MKTTVPYEFITNKKETNYEIIDIRDKVSYGYSHIPSAINIPISDLKTYLTKEKEYYLYCKNGIQSESLAKDLKKEGYQTFSIENGFFGWIQEHIKELKENGMAKKVEESISKKFKKQLFSKFAKALNEYKLIEPNDKIAVCISGGKDSMLLAKLFQELKKHNKFQFDLEFLVMDPGYSKENRKIIELNAEMLNIPITIFETDIFDNVYNIEKSPCYICARMRRGHLYNKAKELGCNKIALGHHYDDVIETILMGMLYGAQIQTMMPKLHSTNFEGMELIRPMYLIRESDIIHWRDYNELYFIQCACKFTENIANEMCSTSNTSSKRQRVKNLIAELKKEDPDIDGHIFKSVENVNLSTIIAYKDKENIIHNFLDEY